MREFLLLTILCAAPLRAQQNPLHFDQAASAKTLWRTSIASLAVANALDVHSSWGKHELNSTLSGSSGTFGREGALIKLGLQGGLIGVEYLVARRRPSARLYRALSFLNFGAATAIGAVSAHNYTVGPLPR